MFCLECYKIVHAVVKLPDSEYSTLFLYIPLYINHIKPNGSNDGALKNDINLIMSRQLGGVVINTSELISDFIIATSVVNVNNVSFVMKLKKWGDNHI